MSARDELLEALMSERYNNTWWKTPPKVRVPASLDSVEQAARDDDITTARRRRVLVEAHIADGRSA